MNIIILVGPPCSGKSTWARSFLKKNSNYIRVNRDELRIMFKGQYISGNKVIEEQVNKSVASILYNAYIDNLNIIIDATHCKLKYINEVLKFTKDFQKIEIEYIIFDTKFIFQRFRNFFRYIKTGIWIPRKVSKTMQENFIKTRYWILSLQNKDGFMYYTNNKLEITRDSYVKYLVHK